MEFHPVVLILAVSLLVHGGKPPDKSPQKWSDTCPADKCECFVLRKILNFFLLGVTIDLNHKNEVSKSRIVQK